jgi:steroid 5-alpha reductase family enzyme
MHSPFAESLQGPGPSSGLRARIPDLNGAISLEKHIRKIFSLFVIVMIALFVLRLRADIWTPLNWMMLAVGAVVCVLVFRVFVYIFNFSYGLACMLNGALLAAWFGNGPALLLGGAMLIYGLRLFLFTWFRVRSDSYAFRVKNVAAADAQMPVGVKFALWVQCSFLYCFHLFAVYLAGQSGDLNAGVIAGTLIILLGTLIEGVADSQKQKAKAIAPMNFVATGLYRGWRHPNYGGEILVQLGLICAGVSVVTAGWADYAAVIVSPLYVILLMISECGRSDKYMDLRYGDKPDFKDYVSRSGCYLPRF